MHLFSEQYYSLKMFYVCNLMMFLTISSVGAEYLCEIFEIDRKRYIIILIENDKFPKFSKLQGSMSIYNVIYTH